MYLGSLIVVSLLMRHDKSKWVLLFWSVEEDDDGEGGIVREVVVVRVGSLGLPTRNLGLVVGIFGLHEGALKGGEGKHVNGATSDK